MTIWKSFYADRHRDCLEMGCLIGIDGIKRITRNKMGGFLFLYSHMNALCFIMASQLGERGDRIRCVAELWCMVYFR